MGHLIFWLLHIAAVIFGFWALVVTVPLHLIYSSSSDAASEARRSAKANRASPDTHVRCPDCKELVLKEARVCKHCGCKLVPQV